MARILASMLLWLWLVTVSRHALAAKVRLQEAQRKSDPTRTENSNAPVTMLTHGCSCSTAGAKLLQDLLVAHGSLIYNTGNPELLKAISYSETAEELRARLHWQNRSDVIEGLIGMDNLTAKFDLLYTLSQEQHETMCFKSELHLMEDNPAIVNRLKAVSARMFLYARTNLVDVLHCRVMDFCNTPENRGLGFLVDDYGRYVNCEFRGRGENQNTHAAAKVFLYPDRVLKFLQRQEAADERHASFLEDHGFSRALHSAEALLAFEYDATMFESSLDAWSELLRAIGISAQRELIADTLRAHGTWPAPKRHSETIANFPAVRTALEDTKYSKMLRF